MLLDEDYEYLRDIEQEVEEDEDRRFLIFKHFPLPDGIYWASGAPVTAADVLIELPSVYNNSGPDMFWTYPYLTLAGGAQIKNALPGADVRNHNDRTYERWSRHWGKAGWRPRVDNISTVVDRLNWAFKYPDPPVT
jgi:hypothetical protein